MRGLEPQPEPGGEPLTACCRTLTAFASPAAEATRPGESAARLRPARDRRGRRSRASSRRRRRAASRSLRKPRLDELLEERSCEQVRPADLVEAPLQEGLRCSCLAAGDAHRHDHANRVGVVLGPDEELLGLVEATLQNADPRQACGRLHTARSLAGFGQLADRRDELLLGGVDPPVRGEDVGATGATEREQSHVVVPPDELLQGALHC